MLSTALKKQYIKVLAVKYIQQEILRTLFTAFTSSTSYFTFAESHSYTSHLFEITNKILEVCYPDNFETLDQLIPLIKNIKSILDNTAISLNALSFKKVNNDNNFQLYNDFYQTFLNALANLKKCFGILSTLEKLETSASFSFLNEEELEKFLDHSAKDTLIDTIIFNLKDICIDSYRKITNEFTVKKENKSATKNNNKAENLPPNYLNEEKSERTKSSHNLYKKILTQLDNKIIEKLTYFRNKNLPFSFLSYERIWTNIELCVQKIHHIFLLNSAYAIAQQYIVNNFNQPEEKLNCLLAQDLIDLVRALTLKYGIAVLTDFSNVLSSYSLTDQYFYNYGVSDEAIKILSSYLKTKLTLTHPSRGQEKYQSEYNAEHYIKDANQECLTILEEFITNHKPAFANQLQELLDEQALFEGYSANNEKSAKTISNESTSETNLNDLDMLTWYKQVLMITSKQLADHSDDKDFANLKKLATAFVMVGFTVRSKEKVIIKQAMITVLLTFRAKYYDESISSKILGQKAPVKQLALAIADVTHTKIKPNDTPENIAVQSRTFFNALGGTVSPGPKTAPTDIQPKNSVATILNQFRTNANIKAPTETKEPINNLDESLAPPEESLDITRVSAKLGKTVVRKLVLDPNFKVIGSDLDGDIYEEKQGLLSPIKSSQNNEETIEKSIFSLEAPSDSLENEKNENEEENEALNNSYQK